MAIDFFCASSLSNTILLILKFRFVFVHLCLSWRVWINSLRHLHQKSFITCGTLLHLFLQYKSGIWKTPGGSITTFDLVGNKLFGDKGLKSSLIASTVSGRELITASVPVMGVCRDPSSKHHHHVFATIMLVHLWLKESVIPIYHTCGLLLVGFSSIWSNLHCCSEETLGSWCRPSHSMQL